MDGVTEHTGELEALVRRLEAANSELRAVNLRLGRERLGRSEAAAASVQSRLRTLREEIAALEETVRLRERRIEELTEIAAHNDELFQIQRAWNDAQRYRVADRVVEALDRLQVLRLVRAVGRLAKRAGR